MSTWVVYEVKLTSDARKSGKNAWYALHVRGVHSEGGAPFAWSVPDVSDPRFDLTRATIEPEASAFLTRKRKAGKVRE